MKAKNFDSDSSSTLAVERSGSSEMATFAFDFNSQQHQAYANYLTNIHGQGQPQSQNKSGVSRTYSQFIKQISRENIAASREDLPATVAADPISGFTPQCQPHPLSQNQMQAQTFSPVSLMSQTSHSYPVTQYARPLTQDSLHQSNGPLTPATGVPLLLSQAVPAQSDSYRAQQAQYRSDSSDRSFSARQTRLTGGGLNVQTVFAPPPRGRVGDRIASRVVAKDGGKKKGILKRVFPQPS